MTWTINPSKDEIAMLMEAGFICRDANKLQEARDLFAGVRALVPKSEAPDVALGSVFVQQSDFDAAITHYQRAIEKNPRSAYAYAHLGEAYLFKHDKENARSCLQKAIELDARGSSGSMARRLLPLADGLR